MCEKSAELCWRNILLAKVLLLHTSCMRMPLDILCNRVTYALSVHDEPYTPCLSLHNLQILADFASTTSCPFPSTEINSLSTVEVI
jgi:hypothetical protein